MKGIKVNSDSIMIIDGKLFKIRNLMPVYHLLKNNIELTANIT